MTPLDQFNERAQFVRVLWKTDRYEVIGIDGRVLFSSSRSRLALHVAEGYESDYAEAVQS